VYLFQSRLAFRWHKELFLKAFCTSTKHYLLLAAGSFSNSIFITMMDFYDYVHCSVLIPPSVRTTVRTSYSNLRLREIEMAQISPHNPLSLPPNNPIPSYPLSRRHWQDRNFRRWDLTASRCGGEAVPSTRTRPYTRARPANRQGHRCSR
jgi:hypothetical protein